MIIALLVVIAGAMVLAGWAQLLATRAAFADSEDLGQERRVTLENARAFARQYILTNMPSGSVPGLTNANFPTPWGNSTITISGSTNIWTTPRRMLVSGEANVNPFSPMERMGYYVKIGATLTDGVNSCPWTFLIRSRSPIAAGFGCVLQNANAAYTATNLPSNYIDFRSGTNGTNILGSLTNTPQIPMTSVTTSSATSYNGTFQLPPNSISSVTFDSAIGYPGGTTNYGYISNTLSHSSIEIVLDPTNTNSYLTYTIPSVITNGTFTNGATKYGTYTSGNTTVTDTLNVYTARIQSSAATNIIQIISTNNNLTNLTLCGTNNSRKIYFYQSGNSTLNLTTTNTANASWNFCMTTSNSPLLFNYTASRTLSIIGGIRSNAQISKVSGSGSFTISQDTSPGNLDDVADRIMWLEDYPTPQ